MRGMHITHLSRILFVLGLLGLTLQPEAAFAVYGGGSVGAGIRAAFTLPGVGSSDIPTFIQGLIRFLRSIVTIVGVLAIVVAGFYLLLSFGNDSSKDTAKKIILYTLIGILVVNLAEAIVSLFVGLGDGNIQSDLPQKVCSIMVQAVSYVALLATLAIVVAGFYLLLGFGSEDSKSTAQRIIVYAIAGILVITFAAAIVNFAFMLSGGSAGSTCIASGSGSGDLRSLLIGMMNFALGFLALLAVIAIVVAGFMLVLSFGSEEARDRAKRIVLYTILGLLAVFFARMIVSFFLNLGQNI